MRMAGHFRMHRACQTQQRRQCNAGVVISVSIIGRDPRSLRGNVKRACQPVFDQRLDQIERRKYAATRDVFQRFLVQAFGDMGMIAWPKKNGSRQRFIHFAHGFHQSRKLTRPLWIDAAALPLEAIERLAA